MKPRRSVYHLVLIVALLCSMLPLGAVPQAAAAPTFAEVEPELQAQFETKGATGYLIYFHEQADLSPAYAMDWEARGRFVVDALQKTAERSQRSVQAYLDAQGVEYQAFWIDNVIVVETSNLTTFNALTSFPEIAALRARRQPILHEPQEASPESILTAIEPNLTHIKADQVWGLGHTGQNIIVANIDTGVRYTHDALVNQYRGNLGGGTFDHNYNWWDPYAGTTAPVDVHDHGSHTIGTIVGDDGGANQIGLAPSAQWIACQGFNPSATDAGLLSCGQFMAAPWDLNGANANPDLRPHVVNNSWGDCGQTYDSWYSGVISAWHAAGVYPVFSNGNASNCGYSSPPGLNTVGNPARSGNVTGVGSTGRSDGQYATYSNWGPTDDPDTVNPRGYPSLKPQVVAPGTNRSAGKNSDTHYRDMSGTSMAGPHVAGLIALMWSAAPCLVGDYATTETIIEETAIPIPYASGGSPPPGPGNVPNYATGWGEIDALAAVQTAIASCGDSALTGEVTDDTTSAPIVGATVEATASPTQTYTTSTNPSGLYTLNVFSGTYTLTVAAFGYQPAVIPDVQVSTGMTVTQDVALTSASWYEVSGTVTDSATGWPLYAEIDIDGFPGPAIWTDPVDGSYSISLPEGVEYTFNVSAWAPGYTPAAITVGPLTGNEVVDVALDANLEVCQAPGYDMAYAYVEDFEADDGSYVPSGTPADEWQWGTPSGWPNGCASGDACWGTNLTGNYSNSANTVLTSPVIDLSGESAPLFVKWWQAWHIESATWDHGYAEVSINGGAWQTMWEHTGSTAQISWTEMSYDISAAAGGNVQFRFRMTSDGSVNYSGYYIDHISISGESGCQIPVDGGLVVGNVYDFETSDPLVGAIVENEAGEAMDTQATPNDPALDDGFYTLFSPSGAQVFTATRALYAPDIQTVSVVSGDTVQQDFYLPVGNLVVDTTGLHAAMDLGDTRTVFFTLENIGSGAAAWQIVEQDEGYVPAFVNAAPVTAAEPREIELGITAADFSEAIQAGPWQPSGAIELVLDDGTSEDAIGLTSGEAFVWFNRFTPDPSDFPFTLDQISLIFRDSANVGDELQLVIWEDTDGDGDPGTGAALLYAANTVVEHNDGTTWNNYALTPPVMLAGPGDVLIGVVNRSGAAGGTHPASIDTTASQGRSWVGAYSAGVPDPPTLPTDDLWGVIDTFGFAGNWMIRASGMTGLPDVPWLSEDPTSGTLAAGSDQVIEVVFDAGVPEITQPGEYYAQLRINNDTPYGPLSIPVTMTINTPDTYGKLEGTVTGLGYCDNDPAPLQGAQIVVESSGGLTWTVQTEADGTYELWLDEGGNPFTVAVTYPDHESGLETDVNIVAQAITNVDFDLRWLQPCVSTLPTSLEVEVPMGTQLTTTLELLNSGAAGTDFEIREKDRGFTPTAGEDVLVVAYDTAAATAMEAALAEHGLSYLRVTRDVFQGTPVDELLEYQAVFYAGGYSGDSWATAMAYMDAGGSFYISDNDLGYGNNATVFYQTYLQSTYNADNGGDFLTGEDLMAGLDLDISADPYPDDFIVGAEGVRIFKYTTSDFAGGVAVEREDYRAIYTAFDFDDVAGAENRTELIGRILDFLVASDVLWITEDPITGTLAANTGSVVVDVVFDANQVAEPGQYRAELQVRTDDLASPLVVPVTMNVTVPGSGKIEGTVTSLGYCDENPALVEGAEVLIESSTGITWTRVTNENGWYALWADPSHAPLTVTVTAGEHESDMVVDVPLVADEVSYVDFELRWLHACGVADPAALHVTLSSGESRSLPLTLNNDGSFPMEFTISEISGTVSILGTPATPAALETAISSTPEQVESGTAAGQAVMGTPSGGPAPQDIGDAWETVAPLPAGRVFNAVVADDSGYIYVIGGTSDAGGGTSTNTNYRYDTATDSWETMAPMPAALNSIDGIFINGQIYIPGDATTADTLVYDIASDSWTTIAANGGYTARSQYQVVAIDTDLYVLGGIVAAASASTTEVWVLDTTTGTWSAGVPMQKSRTSFSATAIDGDIYVAGGVLFPGFTPDMTAEKFDGTAWSYIAGVPDGGGAYTRWSYNADGHGADGLWLAAGRRDAGWSVLNHAAYYDPDTDTWTDSPTIPTLTQGRVYMEGAVASDGYFYVIGGRDSAGSIVYSTNERLYVGYAGAPPVDIPWLAQDPITGTVPADSMRVVDVTFTALPTMTTGTYTATLVIRTNDPMTPRMYVPVTMTITDFHYIYLPLVTRNHGTP